MTDNQGPEDQLTRTLNARADAYVEHGGAPVELSSVLARAGEIRRGRRLRASVVMAAVVLAVAVPVGITVLENGPDRTVAPVATTPRPTAAVPTQGRLARLPQGKPLAHSYVELGVLHNSDGSTQQLPAAAVNRIAAITPYLGGYLVSTTDTSTVTLYDGSGRAVMSGPGSPAFVVSTDGTETAYTMNGRLFSNPSSGMASGYGAVGPIGSGGRPVGYVQAGLLYETGRTTAAGTPQLAIARGGSVGHDLDSLTTLNATDQIFDRVAGITAGGRGQMISLKTHRILWSSATWWPVAFSYDGKYVGATGPAAGAPNSVAILDAATGTVIASSDLEALGINVDSSPVFDDSGNLVFVGREQANQSVAVLRLSPSGRLDRATDVVQWPARSDNTTPLVIPAGPQ